MKEADSYLHFAEIDDLIIKAFAPLFLMSISYSVKNQKPLFLLKRLRQKRHRHRFGRQVRQSSLSNLSDESLKSV